jgi:UDP-N-acetylglucosamine acyltransferase
MSNGFSARIHASAVISPEADLADDLVIGPYVTIEGPVKIGSGCVIRPGAHLIGPLVMGNDNTVFSGAVLGECPQHLKFNGEPTTLEIGHGNIFRENVTIHRGTTQSWTTKIGNDNFFMVNSHVAHDCRIGDRCILANGALVGGHCSIGDNVYLSGNCAVHQFVRLGKLALLSGCSATTKDIPPFVIQQNIDMVVGVNIVGMRRAGMTHEEINAVRKAFKILFREGLAIPNALRQIEEELGSWAAVSEMVTFIRNSQRGINPMRDRGTGLAA